ncbi:MAG TPA: 1,4-alpha-glucan branching protein GlgB [Saprospiraceae bacterium]|jgi:1,4-alpha-glucan branching enzyme|nr:1,4-alpha-glucan branching protein GlgB [Saprospiraceae bacterium]HRO08354.1 1,4-alpha-glucan branching protein GlgB [Saprospiraceae bacterium]HRP41697.1 1,4-alpha-glucan branching protein GlgB [Saprospiraceae bacterium]
MDSSYVLFHTLFTDFDISLFKTGKHYRLYNKMGAHPMVVDGVEGCYFSVYAPNAQKLYVVGDFNQWKQEGYMLYSRWDASGIWEGFIPGVTVGTVYKYKIYPYNFGRIRMKADPYGYRTERPPMSGSVVTSLDHVWHDEKWMTRRRESSAMNQPVSVYEMHFGSWKWNKYANRPLTYVEMSDELIPYLLEMGYTHVEFMPLTEYPYEPSWGYQVTGYFAATSRYGQPKDLMYLIDRLHQAGIGVIMDWVPAHFPADDYALATFDGSCVYEHPDKRKGYHPDWNTLIFNYDRAEVRSFLISNAFFWFEMYHIDGIRVDAVSSMIFLDYSRNQGEWEPNQYGGRENLDAISLVQELNTALYKNFPGVQTIAEESTAHPKVSKPVFEGGLGFGMKWMMGWMHDSNKYFKREFIYRRYHQNDITFSIAYAFSENFMLALSHDEVVHGKSSMIGKMAGDEWQKFANLRTYYSYMFTHPGTKLLFMGNDFAPYTEWNFTEELEWELLQYPSHKGINSIVKDLNFLYRNERALHHYNFDSKGFTWVDAADKLNSILITQRCSDVKNDVLMIVLNLNTTPHKQYKIGLNAKQAWKLIFNSDDTIYWGSGYEIATNVKTIRKRWNDRPHTLYVDIPPLSATVYRLISSVEDKPLKEKGSKKILKPVITPEVTTVEEIQRDTGKNPEDSNTNDNG